MGGGQIGMMATLSNHPVTNGFFTGVLDFGAGVFNGQARWLEIQVQGPGDAGFTTLAPLQPITARHTPCMRLAAPWPEQWVNDANGTDYLRRGNGTRRGTTSSSGRTAALQTTDVLVQFLPEPCHALRAQFSGANGFVSSTTRAGKHYMAGRVGGARPRRGPLQCRSSGSGCQRSSARMPVTGSALGGNRVTARAFTAKARHGSVLPAFRRPARAVKAQVSHGSVFRRVAGQRRRRVGKSASNAGVYGETFSASAGADTSATTR